MQRKIALVISVFCFSLCWGKEAQALTWTLETVATDGGGWYPVMALGSNNKVYVAYLGTGGLKYATNVSGSWVTQVADASGSAWGDNGIAVDSNLKVHIAQSYGGTPGSALAYTTNTSGTWVTEVVDSTGQMGYMDIKTDNNAKAYISYSHPAGEKSKYATNASGSWVLENVATYSYGGYTAIDLNSSNKAYIGLANNGVYGDAEVWTNASGVWASETAQSTGTVGDYIDIDVNSSNKSFLSYYDEINQDLLYATNNSGTWVTQTVDSTGVVGSSYTSIAVDSSNYAYISYYDSTNANLKFATNSSGSWVTTTLDSTGDVGSYSSIALDSSGNVYIVYRDSTNGYVKYAYGDNGNTTTDKSGTNISLTDSASGVSGYVINYANITTSGNTTVTAVGDANYFVTNSGGMVGSILSNTFRNISTTASFTGSFNLEIPYSQTDVNNQYGVGFNESFLRLFHRLSNGTIEDVTTSVDTINNIVYGRASSFSDFGVGVNPEPATLLLLGSALFGFLPRLRKKR